MFTRAITRLKINVADLFPFTSRWSRFMKALYYAGMQEKQSYSQHGEDVFIWQLLNEYFPDKEYTYIDVGGFHPALLSNSYLLYRRNMRGVVIEPNSELIKLHRLFRSKDSQLEVACSNKNGISKFYFQTTFPALSSLSRSNKKTQCRLVPVLSLDTIYNSLEFTKVFFLSIDAEGADFEVLQGAEQTLRNTFIVCIENDSMGKQDNAEKFLLARHFSFVKRFACNSIFMNEKFECSTVINQHVVE